MYKWSLDTKRSLSVYFEGIIIKVQYKCSFDKSVSLTLWIVSNCWKTIPYKFKSIGIFNSLWSYFTGLQAEGKTLKFTYTYTYVCVFGKETSRL